MPELPLSVAEGAERFVNKNGGNVLSLDAAKAIQVSRETFWPTIPNTEPFSEKDVNKALSLTLVKNAPAITALSASAMAVGTFASGYNPYAGLLISKAAPLGYAAWKYHELATMAPRDFWKNMDSLERELNADAPSFWRGVGKAYAFGTADKYMKDPNYDGDAIGEMAGSIFRDFVVAHGFGKAIGAFVRGPDAVAALSSGGRRMAGDVFRSYNSAALAGAFAFDRGVVRYNKDIGMGSSDEVALHSAIAAGVAAGASGFLFMSALPAATAKYASRLYSGFAPRIFIAGAEFSGFVAVDEQTNNLIRSRVYGLPRDSESNLGDLAKIAGVGAAFSSVGMGASALFSLSGRRFVRYANNKKANVEVAQRVANAIAEDAAPPALQPTVQKAESVTQPFDVAAFRMNYKQIKDFVDDARALIYNGTDVEEAIRTTWKNKQIPDGFKNEYNYQLITSMLSPK